MKISKILKKQKLQFTVLAVLILELAFPFQIAAASMDEPTILPNLVIVSAEDAEEELNLSQANMSIYLAVPRREYKVVATYYVDMTAYSSTIDQTDSTPCITANGFDLCAHNQEDVIAANFLPFGTKVRFPELFGDRIFTVQDRMNARYYYRADVWMKTREAAIKFGYAYAKLEVVE